MTVLSRHTLDILGVALEGDSAEAVGQRFFERLQPYGVRASYIRSYGGDVVGEHVYSRVSPPGWEDFYREEDFGRVNYLPREIRRRTGAFAWSDVRLNDPEEVALAQALAYNGFPDGLAVPCHGACGYVAAVSLAFQDLAGISPDERHAIELSSIVLHERMRSLSKLGAETWIPLSVRERDVLAFAAEGRSRDDVSSLTGLPEAMVASLARHSQSKLGVRNQAHAVARAFEMGQLASHQTSKPAASDPRLRNEALSYHLKQSFQLSGAETRLAIGLYNGATLKQVAERSGISINTVRVQLASIFGKTNTHRQAELMRLMTELTLTP